MPFENSPSLDAYKNGMPERPRRSSTEHRRVWLVIAVLSVVVVLLLGVNLWDAPAVTHLRGTGTVTGQVVNERGDPIQAEIFVLKTALDAQTDDQGYFTLKQVPAGEQILVIAYLGVGREVRTVVASDTVTDLGRIQFASTRVPEF